MKTPVPVLFTDIDSTVRHGYDELGHFVNRIEDVVIFPEALQQMRRWKRSGGRIVGVSNQGGIALRKSSPLQIGLTMLETRGRCEALFDSLLWCPHHPNSPVESERECWCRKPQIGMLVQAVNHLQREYPSEHYPHSLMVMVGDREEDQQLAANAGIAFKWASAWRIGGKLGSRSATTA